jgi:hypothetical protein
MAGDTNEAVWVAAVRLLEAERRDRQELDDLRGWRDALLRVGAHLPRPMR